MTGRRGPAGWSLRGGAVLPLLVALALPGPLAAQTCRTIVVPATTSWHGPLARSVQLDATDLPLRDALARIAEGARVRISHSLASDPLDRRVCATLDDVAVGDALVALLRDLSVRPVAASDDHVVLTPARAQATPAQATTESRPIVSLQPIVVRADPARPTNNRRDLVVDVLDGRRLAEAPHGQLGPALNAVVPGMYLWGGGAGAGYASIRGASSFESTAPKVYIDGVQVANPQLLTRLSPESIERIEVIRGPQGAALYGADAISGVLDITTRGAAARSGPQFGLRSSFGLSATAFSPGTAIAHDHALHVSLGSARRSASLDAALGTSGEPLAGSWSRHFDAGAAVRLVGDRSLFSGTLRFQSQRAATAIGPVTDASIDPAIVPRSLLAATRADELSVQHFTAGLRASIMPEGPWTHTFVAGLDGYALEGGEGSARDAFAAAFGAHTMGSGAVRGTFRATSSASVQPTADSRAAFTASVEHARLRRAGLESIGLPLSGADSAVSAEVRVIDASRNDTGVGAQLDLSLDDRWFLTGGMRFEYTDALAGLNGIATLPSIGAAWTALDGPVDIKLRTSWGKGIRWPELATGGPGWETLPVVYVPLDLGPEQQTGIEAGVDVDVGDALSLRLTRFDQTASGLVQRVVLPLDHALARHQPDRPTWAYQNVGEITNRGWEVQGTAARGPLTVVATFASVDSRVQQLAYGYAGDLRPGDRMLGVPARTYGMNATWAGRAWSANLGASRAADWMNYDRIALSAAMLDGTADFTRDGLRQYWRRYEGLTHLSAFLTRDLDAGVTLVLSGDNLLNRQTGEPDNATVMRGRTVSLGVRATF